MSEVTPIKKAKPRKKTKKQNMTKVCDQLFSKLIRMKGFCEACGKSSDLQCAHGFSRSYRATRWDFANAFSLCRACHVYFTHRPIEWDDWLQDRWGASYDLIRDKALNGPLPSLQDLAAELRTLLEESECTGSSSTAASPIANRQGHTR